MPQLSQFPRSSRAVTPALTFANIPGSGDVKILNYALALEALEADLYQQAILRLTTGGTNALGINIPGLGLTTNDIDVQYLSRFAQVEADHRNFLDSNLAGASIIGTGANGILNKAKFDFGIQSLSRQQVDELIYNIEATGVQAYLGAVKFFTPGSQFLLPAASIQATEARHTAVTAIILNVLFREGKETAPLSGETNTINTVQNTAGIDGTLEPDQVLAAASAYIVLPQ